MHLIKMNMINNKCKKMIYEMTDYSTVRKEFRDQ